MALLEVTDVTVYFRTWMRLVRAVRGWTFRAAHLLRSTAPAEPHHTAARRQ